MSQPYPIVSQAQLKEPPRRGLWSLGGPRRPDGEVPALNPHEVLVYRVGGQFIVDDGRRGLDDNRVVSATSVSVVNMRRGSDVEVTFETPSKDAAKFVVQVNFVCSVVDAITVVRDGQTNAAEALLAYLKGYQPLFELGLKHPLAEINAVRREAWHHVNAYTTMSPPKIPGMSIALANVQVMTPEELSRHEEIRRAEEWERFLAVERLQGEQTIKQQQQKGDHSLKKQSQEADYVLKEEQQESEHRLTARRQEQDQVLKVREQEAGQLFGQRQQESDHQLGWKQHEYDLKRTQSIAQTVGHDSREALLMAHIRGEVTADDYARRLRLLEEEDWQRSREVEEAKRLADEKAAEIARSEARDQAELTRADEKEAAAIKRAFELKQLEWEYEDKREETRWRRTVDEREANDARERRQQEVEAELEILREFNKRGLLDNYYPDIDEIMRRIRGDRSIAAPPEAIEDVHMQLAPAENDTTTDEPKKSDLREEDGY